MSCPLPRRSPSRLLILFVIAATLAGACRREPARSQGDDTAEVELVPVGVEPVEIGSLRATIHASGMVVPADGAEFLAIAPEPARVVEVTRNQGDAVAAGDLLVRFELIVAAQEVARQQAEVARTQALFENVRANRAKTADFAERGLVARNDLAQADRELAEAQNTVNAAAAALKRAQDALARGSVLAPFAGIVANRLHNPGDLAQASPTDPVVRVVDPKRLEVLVALPGADASRVLPGASARVAGTVDGQTSNLSVVARPSGNADAGGNLRVRLTFNGATTLPVDSPVEVDIDAEERTNVVFVAPEWLVGTGPDAAVFVANGDVAERRTVTTGVTTERGVEIVSGLNAGELVIVRGQSAVRNGARISATR
jgi:RND family efflux transporter MFP subunit